MSVPHLNLHQVKHYFLHLLSAKRRGHGVHSPFVFSLCEEVFYNHYSFYDFERLHEVRKKLLKNKRIIDVEDLGTGSKVLRSKKRIVKEIAKHGISKERQSELIYLLINFLKCESRIELGTSLGLNTLYMASANKSGQVYSIEGSPQLLDFASGLAIENKINGIKFIGGNFAIELPKLLEEIRTFDLIYIDGNHAYEPTLSYFQTALNHKTSSSVMIFDDIYWSKEMTRAWEKIRSNVKVKLSVDCFYFGLVFFREEIKEKQDVKLFI